MIPTQVVTKSTLSPENSTSEMSCSEVVVSGSCLQLSPGLQLLHSHLHNSSLSQCVSFLNYWCLKINPQMRITNPGRRCPGRGMRLWRTSSREATGREEPGRGTTAALQWVSPGISCIDLTRSTAERPFLHKELVSISMEMHSPSFPLLLMRSMSQSSHAVWGSQSFRTFQLSSLSLYFCSGDLFHSKKNSTSHWLNVVLFLANEHLGTSESDSFGVSGLKGIQRRYFKDKQSLAMHWLMSTVLIQRHNFAERGQKHDGDKTEAVFAKLLRPQRFNLASSFGHQARKDSQLAPRQGKGKEKNYPPGTKCTHKQFFSALRSKPWVQPVVGASQYIKKSRLLKSLVISKLLVHLGSLCQRGDHMK